MASLAILRWAILHLCRLSIAQCSLYNRLHPLITPHMFPTAILGLGATAQAVLRLSRDHRMRTLRTLLSKTLMACHRSLARRISLAINRSP